MSVLVMGDFADPLSFLASQRVEQIASLGLCDVRWAAVESDRTRPMSGRPLDAATAARVAALASPGEVTPEAGMSVPSSRAATAAYAESVTDGWARQVRCALFDAMWVEGRRLDDPDVVRTVVFHAYQRASAAATVCIEERIRANRLLLPLGDPDVLATTRRFGVVISSARGPLTVAGRNRLDGWRRLWAQRGTPALPLVLTDIGEAITGEHAVRWLARALPHDRTERNSLCPTTHRPSTYEPKRLHDVTT